MKLPKALGQGSFFLLHSVWKSPKKSHSTLRAKRATFTFWVDQSLLKMPKMANLKSWSLWSNSVTRQVNFDRTKLVENAKIGKFECDILSNWLDVELVLNFNAYPTMHNNAWERQFDIIDIFWVVNCFSKSEYVKMWYLIVKQRPWRNKRPGKRQWISRRIFLAGPR